MTSVNADWQQHAYPLKQITIKLLGTKHSTLAALLTRLQEITDRATIRVLGGQ